MSTSLSRKLVFTEMLSEELSSTAIAIRGASAATPRPFTSSRKNQIRLANTSAMMKPPW